MRQSQVVIGHEYECKVSGNLVIVKVLEKVECSWSRKKTRFRVALSSTGKVLPKLRTAAALRKLW